MRDRVLAVLVSLAVFAMGLLAGLWIERHRPVPPPPGAFMGEFGARPGPRDHGRPPGPPVNRAQLLEQIAKLRPEMESFTAHIAEIYAQFDRDLEPILTPEQRDLYERNFRSHRLGNPPGMGDDTKPLSDEQIDQLMQRPMRTLTYFVIVPMTLDRMANDLNLDATQREKVKDLLRVRREKFIELVDSAPPPSMMLSRLAPFAQRLGAPAAAPSPTPAH